MGGALNRAATSPEAGAPDRARESVVVLHGLWMIGSVMGILRRRLAPHGFHVSTFNYASIRQGLEENAARLAEFTARVPGDTVHLLHIRGPGQELVEPQDI